MKRCIFTVFTGILLANIAGTIAAATVESTSTVSRASCEFPVHDIRNCPMQQWFDSSQSSRVLEVLPGLGFDNLRHVDMGQVHFYNYSKCKVTADGKFVIPDSTFIVPIQESHYKFSADYFDHWDNYTSITSSNVKSGFSLFNFLGGAFSKEKQSVKQNQVNHKSKTTRVTFRNRVYTIRLDTSADLHPTFKSKIYEIAACLQNNDTEMAYYLSELLVRDYGTHYITSVETGAVFAKLDYISESYASHEEASNVAYAAAFSLPILQLFRNGSFDLGYGYSYSEDKVKAFFRSRKRSEIFTIGGAPFTPDLDLTKWLLEVPDKMAIIDRTADPLHFVLTPSRFPELLPTTIREVSDYVLTAIGWYYRYNTKPGCVDPKAKNFDFQANYDDSSYCDTRRSYEDMAFGGIYQTCTNQGREDLCNGVLKTAHVNPQTGGNSCPPGYQSVLLQQASVSYSKQYERRKKSCKLWIFCKTRTYFETHVSHARYKIYWCVATKGLNPNSYRGYLFGGYFTPTNSNPLTGSQSCPPYFRNQRMASDVTICVSNDYELASIHAVKFGGFHSCRVGNPLAIPSTLNKTVFTISARWPHSCPAGYSQHLVDVDDGCEINVCLESGAFSPKYSLPPFLPPFHEQPPYIPHWTDRLAVVGADNNLLIRSTQGQWKPHTSDSDETKAFVQTAMENNNITESSAFGVAAAASQEKDGPSKWALISLIMSTVALASFILLACMTSVVTCKVCCGRKRGKKDKVKNVEQGRVPLIMPPNLESQQL